MEMYSKAYGISEILLDVSAVDNEDSNCPIEIESGLEGLLLSRQYNPTPEEQLCKFMTQVSIRNQALLHTDRTLSLHHNHQSFLTKKPESTSVRIDGFGHQANEKLADAPPGSQSDIRSIQSKTIQGTCSSLSGEVSPKHHK